MSELCIIIIYTCSLVAIAKQVILAGYSSLQSNLAQLLQTMATALTDSPAWIEKMKTRFAVLDVDKNGIINEDDVALLAKNLAEYRKEGKDAEKRYFDTLKAIWSFGIGVGRQCVNEDEFVEEMKQFVTKPDARERVNTYAAKMFEIMDADKNGVIDFGEFRSFHKAGANTDNELFKQFFYDADTNYDGVIQPSELEASVARFLLSAD